MGDITLHCMNGFTVHARGNNIVVESKRKEDIYPIAKIQSFALKEPHALSPGTITFRTAQAASSGIRLSFGVSAAIGAEQSFFFAKGDLDTALQLRDYVSNFNAEDTSRSDKKVVSVVDEIRGLKSLLDEGILTQAEFDAKKRQLLGL